MTTDDLSSFLQWESITRDTIDFKKAYVDMAGDLIAGLMLSQIVFYYLPSKKGESKLRVEKEGHLWIAKRHSEWHEEIRITEWQAPRALDILAERGLITKKVFRFGGSPTVHIRLNPDQFLSAWKMTTFPDSSQMPESKLGNGLNPFVPNARMEGGESRETLTEITAKTTEERKGERIATLDDNLGDVDIGFAPTDLLGPTPAGLNGKPAQPPKPPLRTKPKQQRKPKGQSGQMPLNPLPNSEGRKDAPPHSAPPPPDPVKVHAGWVAATFAKSRQVYPNQAQLEEIRATVTDLERWERNLRAWALAGYTPGKVDGQLDWYRRDVARNGNGQGSDRRAIESSKVSQYDLSKMDLTKAKQARAGG